MRYANDLSMLQPNPEFDLGGERTPPTPTLRRSPVGWVLLAVIFALLISQNFVKQPGKPGRNAAPDLTEQELALRQAIMINALKQAAGPQAASQLNLDDSVELFTKLKTRAKADESAARLYVAGMYELGKPLSDEEIAGLAGATKAENRGFYEVYRLAKLDGEDMDRLTKTIPKQGFTYQVALLHAWEKAGDKEARERFSPLWKVVAIGALIFILLGSFLIGIALWILYGMQRASGRLAPQGHPAEPLSLAEADRFALRAALLFLIFLGSGQLIRPLLMGFLPDTQALAAASVVAALLMVAAHWLPVLGLRIPLARVGISRRSLGKDLVWGLAGYAASLPLLAIVLAISVGLTKVFGPAHHPVQDMIRDMSGPLDYLSVLIMGSLVAAFWEEIAFRGTLLPALSRVLGKPVWGIVAAAVLFASIHPQGVAAWLGLGSIGAIVSMLAYQTRSLIPSMVLHAVNNAVLLTLFSLIY